MPDGLNIWNVNQVFTPSCIYAAVPEPPSVTLATWGLVRLGPVAAPSSAAMVRRVGPKRWQLLHRLVYFCTLAGVIHYYWLVKSDVREPLMYGGILTLLMLFRIRMWLTKGAKNKPQPTAVGA